MKTAYDQSVYPPAPRLIVQLGRPGEALRIEISALVDTGADITLLPRDEITALRLRPMRSVHLRGPWGDRHLVRIYRVDVGVGSIRLPSVEVAADASITDPILGRALLNKLRMLLDGPNLVLDVQE